MAPGNRDDGELEEGSAAEEDNNGRVETTEVVGGVVEMPAPPSAGNATGQGESGASNKIRTAMEATEIGTSATEEGDDEEEV